MWLFRSKSLDWFVLFRFDDAGYVKDDDKDKLNANELMSSFRKGNDAANEQRRSKGIPEIRLIGWEMPPRYNPESHNLEWAIRGESEGHQVINHKTRLLGRTGVMEVGLVASPEEYQNVMPQYKELIESHSYNSGQKYAEYRPGDKVAKYGLAALITAGVGVEIGRAHV